MGMGRQQHPIKLRASAPQCFACRHMGVMGLLCNALMTRFRRPVPAENGLFGQKNKGVGFEPAPFLPISLALIARARRCHPRAQPSRQDMARPCPSCASAFRPSCSARHPRKLGARMAVPYLPQAEAVAAERPPQVAAAQSSAPHYLPAPAPYPSLAYPASSPSARSPPRVEAMGVAEPLPPRGAEVERPLPVAVAEPPPRPAEVAAEVPRPQVGAEAGRRPLLAAEAELPPRPAEVAAEVPRP